MYGAPSLKCQPRREEEKQDSRDKAIPGRGYDRLVRLGKSYALKL